MTWGRRSWGQTPWGGVPPAEGPTDALVFFTAIEPLADAVGVAPGTHVSFRIASAQGVNILTLSTSVGGTNFILAGVAQNGAVISIVANDQNGFDIQIDLPGQLPLNTQQEVAITILDIFGRLALGSYVFTVGVGPRLLLVRNPKERVLLAQFNCPMRRDTNLFFLGNWKVAPVSAGATSLTIVQILGYVGLPDTVLLRYVGGGSIYRLTVVNLLSQAGDPIERGYNSVEFEILFGDEEEPTIRLFDTIFGPIGMVQRLRERRTIDGHVVNRSLALGMDETFRIKQQALDVSTDLTGRPGKNRI